MKSRQMITFDDVGYHKNIPGAYQDGCFSFYV
jgi:hypothetical protein